MKAAPTAPLVMPEPDFLLEFLIVALDAPAQFGEIDQTAKANLPRQARKPVFRRLLSPAGHSINSHSSGHGSLRSKSRWALRMRSRAKRDRSGALLPARQVMQRQALAGRPKAGPSL